MCHLIIGAWGLVVESLILSLFHVASRLRRTKLGSMLIVVVGAVVALLLGRVKLPLLVFNHMVLALHHKPLVHHLLEASEVMSNKHDLNDIIQTFHELILLILISVNLIRSIS